MMDRRAGLASIFAGIRTGIFAGMACCIAGATFTTPARADRGYWSYAGEGDPAHWGGLRDDFEACAIGTQQSPIDLGNAVSVTGAVPVVRGHPAVFRVLNNGHTIQAEAVEDAGGIELNGKTYVLNQFHFHGPAEHRLEGRQMPMEVHFVHAAQDGDLLVLGVFLVPGEPNAGFSQIMKAVSPAIGTLSGGQHDLPHADQHHQDRPDPGKTLQLDPRAFLPEGGSLYRYEGSLTTPPCSEIVDWNIYAEPVQVGAADMDAFRDIFPMNARPLQTLNRRFLLKMPAP